MSPSSGRLALYWQIAVNLMMTSVFFLPSVQREPVLGANIAVAYAAMVVWQIILAWRVWAKGESLSVRIVIQRAHCMQPLFQGPLLLYWGLYWPNVFEHLPLLLVQLVFAYLFDMVLSWSRHREWRLGFGPFPIIVSLNFFLWFRNEYFILQLAQVAVAYLAKEFITWQRDGQRVHIFNPSAFPLAVFTLIFSTPLLFPYTQGTDFSVSFVLPPNFLEVIFLVSLVVNIWYPTVLITGFAALAMVLLFHATPWPFPQPILPQPFDAAVFLGATLLVTDPATSPRSKVARALFGFSYGVFTVATAAILHLVGLPGFLDKVVAAPLVNLLVPQFDHVGERLGVLLARNFPTECRLFAQRRIQLVIWTLFFIGILPSLKFAVEPLLFPPEHVLSTITPEMRARRQTSAVFCNQHREICKPFGLIDEIRLLVGSRR